VKLADLKNFEVDQIKALTSWNAIDAYKSGKVTLADLKGLEADKIEALTSWYARQAYKSGCVKLADLKNFEADMIKSIVSSEESIENFVKNKTKNLLINKVGQFSYEVSEFITSTAISAHDAGAFTPFVVGALSAITGYFVFSHLAGPRDDEMERDRVKKCV